ncbi:hypothetical protein, partial [Marinobacter salarius]
QFRTTYPSVIWKLLLQTGTRMVDATDFVTEVVREHAEAFNNVPTAMTPEGWIIRVANLNDADSA